MAEAATVPPPTTVPIQSLPRGLVKQVLSGDAVVLQGQAVNGPPPEYTFYLSNVARLERRPTETSPATPDEFSAFQAYHFLESELLGRVVYYQLDYTDNVGRKHGRIYVGGMDGDIGQDIAENMVHAGLVEVRQDEYATKLLALQDQAKAAGKGKWSITPALVREIEQYELNRGLPGGLPSGAAGGGQGVATGNPVVSQPNTTRTTHDAGLGPDDQNKDRAARGEPPGFQPGAQHTSHGSMGNAPSAQYYLPQQATGQQLYQHHAEYINQAGYDASGGEPAGMPVEEMNGNINVGYAVGENLQFGYDGQGPADQIQIKEFNLGDLNVLADGTIVCVDGCTFKHRKQGYMKRHLTGKKNGFSLSGSIKKNGN